ncbi:DoxX family protein [Sphingobium sp. YR768]|jgi:putative oxidoreductase|uniref:DoxX family protein n=1 Tax=Sphingobium sp. YR768 TaxID=1884365 RepID=UPI0008BCB529|nr:DoxX family protein [Sphingobium sp. YR768]SER31072.1 putative oxidoreductase [Sphingobium sp. YR768]
MTNTTSSITIWTPRILSIFRVVTALLFLSHGIVKLFGFPAGAAPGQVPLFTLFGLAGVLELAGGFAVMLGIFTRPIAFLLSGQMAVAYFMVHLPMGFYPVLNMGELAILFCFNFLYLAFAGAGAWSIDAKRGA